MLGEEPADEGAALRGEMNDAGAAVVFVVAANDEAAAGQAVDGGGDGTTGEQHLSANLVDRERAFVKQRFENAEVAGTKSERDDARMSDGFQRPRGFPKDEPETDARGRGLLGEFRLRVHSLDIKMLHVKKRCKGGRRGARRERRGAGLAPPRDILTAACQDASLSAGRTESP